MPYNFLNKSVEEVKQKCSKQGDIALRKRSYRWHLSVEDTKHEVCQIFFLHTLDISDKMVFSAYKKKTDIGVIEEDKRETTKCVQMPDKKELENIFVVSLKQRVIIVENNLVAIT